MTGIDDWYDWGYFIFNCDDKMGEIWDFPNSLAFLPRENLTRRSNACGPFRKRYKKTYPKIFVKSEWRLQIPVSALIL